MSITMTIMMADRSGSPTSVTGVVAAVQQDPSDLIAAMKGVQVAVPAYLDVSYTVANADFVPTLASGTDEVERSKKWAILCKDNVTKRKFTKYVPCADFTKSDNDILDLSTGAGATLKTALESTFKSPAGNAFTCISAKKSRS